jgi:hypothetical protein
VFFPGADGFVSDGYTYLCRDFPEGSIEELVVMLSYADVSEQDKILKPVGLNGGLLPSTAFCHSVAIEATYQTDDGSGVVYRQQLSGKMTSYAQWETDTNPVGGVVVGGMRFWGTVDRAAWSVEGTDQDGCTHSGSASSLNLGADAGDLRVIPFASDPHAGAVDWDGFNVSDSFGEWTISCPAANPGDPPLVTTAVNSLVPITFDPYLLASTTLQQKMRVGVDGAMVLDLPSAGYQKVKGSVVVRPAR